ncbi:UDP binding domain-containing protein [Devosia algicola]|uniref:UDP binding domain-containing protein n=1 Tax=Devosia algicola TaxID=3026418 RepID=UPI002E1C5CDE
MNDNKPNWVVDKVSSAVKEAADRCAEVTVVCLGLAFKANVDDFRESPALEIVEMLTRQDVSQRLLVVEPFIECLPASLEGHVQLMGLEEALAQADVVVLLVDHLQFKAVDQLLLAGKTVIDTRGSWL